MERIKTASGNFLELTKNNLKVLGIKKEWNEFISSVKKNKEDMSNYDTFVRSNCGLDKKKCKSIKQYKALIDAFKKEFEAEPMLAVIDDFFFQTDIIENGFYLVFDDSDIYRDHNYNTTAFHFEICSLGLSFIPDTVFWT